VVDYLDSSGLKESAALLEKEAKVDVESKVAAKGLLEKKWTSVLRLQKKMMQLEEENKQLKENAANVGPKRPTTQLLPVAPATHTLQGHRAGVTCVRFHPQYPQIASASEDATIKFWDCEVGDTCEGNDQCVHKILFYSLVNLSVHLRDIQTLSSV
jgi:platelet-activating factor acetylhydrolase IB subunit alpha